jgi:hypothetical protein
VAAPNLQAPTTIRGKTAVQVLGSVTAIVANASSSGLLKRVYSLTIGNNTTSPVAVTVDVYRSSTAYRILKDTIVPANGSIMPISRDNVINLEEGDDLRLTGTSALEAVASFDEIA